MRRFHVTLDQIHLRDYEQWCRFERTSPDEHYTPPAYTVIAHSLGSVMSFDALVYAFANPDIRAGKTPHVSGSLPFPGYRANEEYEEEAWDSLIEDIQKPPAHSDWPSGEENLKVFKELYPQLSEKIPRLPPLLWRNNIANFITLGSPIDKFHVLWHQNYRHMGLMHHDFPDKWAEDWLENEASPRIPHYNLCDAQDPVGHHLEEAQSCQNYKKVFDTSIPVTYRDVVFRRYPVPGVAHTQYWKDQQLFEILINSVIDNPSTQSESDKASILKKHKETDRFVHDSFMVVPGCYRSALEWAYFRIPLLTAVVTSLLLSYGIIEWYQDGFSLSYFSAILVAVLLWIMPRSSKRYQKEVLSREVHGLDSDSEKTHREEPSIFSQGNHWWEFLKPRASLFANLVRGAVTWRRILIWLNQHPNQAFTVDDALRCGVRRSLESPGDFKAHVQWRALVVVLVLGICLLMLGWYPSLTPNQLSPYLPDWLYVMTQVTFIISICYLAVMGYVGMVFVQMRRESHKYERKEDINKERETYSSESVQEGMDHLSVVNFE